MTTMQTKIVRQNTNNVNIFIIDETMTAEQIAKVVHQEKNNVNIFIIDEMTTTQQIVIVMQIEN